MPGPISKTGISGHASTVSAILRSKNADLGSFWALLALSYLIYMLAKIQNIYKRKRRNDRNRLALIFSFPIILLLKEGNFDYFCPKLILFPKLIACAIMIATTAKTINVAICFTFLFN